MSQTALPVPPDIVNTGWNPVPVSSTIAAHQTVTTTPDPTQVSFTVKLAALSWPSAGPQKLTVNLRADGPAAAVVVIRLLQGSQVIATTVTNPGTTFQDVVMELTEAQKASITDYTDLSLTVVAGASSGTLTYTSSATWIALATTVTVECWGEGGSGGNSNNIEAGGGGGGGYSKRVVTGLTIGNSYTVNIGSGGTATDTWFDTSGTVLARHGAVGSTSGPSFLGGAGGAAGIGDTTFTGGNGGNGGGGTSGARRRVRWFDRQRRQCQWDDARNGGGRRWCCRRQQRHHGASWVCGLTWWCSWWWWRWCFWYSRTRWWTRSGRTSQIDVVINLLVDKLILKSFQSPGDVLMLTAAVRDLHQAHPGQFQTDVRTSADALWQNNPYLTRLQEGAPGVRTLDMHYPLIHQSNQRPYHFIHGYVQYLEQQLNLRIPVTRFQGDIHLSSEEKSTPPVAGGVALPERFWIVVAGGKFDFTAKWWNPASFQQVVDHFQGRIAFVQCGEQGHWHPRQSGVIDLVGKTNLREFVRLMYHADGVLCPVTFAMHLAAAVATKPGRPRHRPCVVVAGGREPPHWEAYPHHQFLSTVGALSCCADGGCWKSRCQLVGDGDMKDRRDVCEQPVQVAADLRIPRCMELITPADVIRRIEIYYEGGALSFQPEPAIQPAVNGAAAHEISRCREPSGTGPARLAGPTGQAATRNVLLEFRHGLGDAVQLTIVLKHLRHYHPDWNVDVAALVGKHSAYQGLCRNVMVADRDPIARSDYDHVFGLEWHECRSGHASRPSTKPIRCLQEVFHLTPIAELCRYAMQISDRARALARGYLNSICKTGPDGQGRFPAVLIHYQGNTSSDRKDLPHELIRDVCAVIQRLGMVAVILDWDRRTPLADGANIHNPGADHELWGGRGTGDAEVLAALIDAARLMIGVDSGPLHVAGATTTPTIGVWTHHHPVHFFDLADNVVHLVPGDHVKLAASQDCVSYFTSQYRHRVYKQLHVDLPALVESMLTGQDFELLAMKGFLGKLSARGFDERYYQEHKVAGLDYLGFGDWQRQYGRWLVEALGLKGKKVLDVGCACGAIVRGFGEAGAVVQGVDVNEHMIRLGRERWPDMAPLLFVCDAVNLHVFEDGLWDALHSAQVAEHWKPELVPLILRELHRVVKPGGLFFCCLDTEELFSRQARTMDGEDPTHVCIRPMRWWHERLAEAGWQACSAEFEPALRRHAEDFLRRYDWDWFVARRMPAALEIPAAPPGLMIAGKEIALSAEHTLRWVDEAEGAAQAVLYQAGKRVTDAWSLNLDIRHPGDPHGGNANTA